MTWGCMTSKGLASLLFIEGNINSTNYQNILEVGLLPILAESSNTNAPFIFQQDLAPAHNSRSTRNWFQEHEVTVLEWPGNSPDLNPIENVWGYIKTQIRKANPLPRTREEFKSLILRLWSTFPIEACKKLINSMPNRCQEVITSKGYPTKY